ncbi:autotransporter-associated beta strand repeat-containing protein [Luteolibacter ambystomatis]|uniref:Autotransporter-associated beta strand repeat-containing protein n=1 Tax=Luteolibacter ambystomatis TaxID=2824561 RepID=A0A975J2I7_9BACT|nr:autotransporter-associated beta strand repeat-containing protein [Luteolibacter ambystomatis]QUE52852.1 autotransporter-associated beta strand repeat-containing protein [Luteolibacter ambystomatis]
MKALRPAGPARRQDLVWKDEIPEPAFATFRDWTRRYEAADAEGKKALVGEGIELATVRRAGFADLMHTDPARALELVVPVTVRRHLPQQVLAFLETPVDKRGDIEHYTGVSEEGAAAPPEFYEVQVDGASLKAYVTAERSGQPSRYGVPVHGYQLDSSIVVRPTAGRLLEPVEVGDAHAAKGEAICPVSEQDTRSQGDEAGLAVGEETDLFCSSAHAALELEERTAAEQNARPGGEMLAAAGGDGGGGEVTAESSHTEGVKTILFIRVDFSDHTGAPVDGAVILPYIANAWSAWSYGRCTVNTANCATTPILRMPKVAGTSGYNGASGTLYTDALAAATSAGYTPGNYSFVMVCMDNATPGFTFAGLGTVGGNKTWLRAEGSTYAAQVATHELGHNLGLNHAQSYVVSGSNPIASGGTTSEYGDPYNTMGNGDVYSPYNARYKLYLNWLTSSDYTTVTTSGVYRIAAHDKSTATGVRGLKVARTGSQDYCLDYMTERSGSQATYNDNGIQVRWGPTGTGNGKTQILDMTSGSGNGLTDAPLAIGRTFADVPNKVYITTLAKVTGASFDSMDVLVNTNVALPPPPWTSGDIGTVAAAGRATYDSAKHLIYGSGADIWGSADAFHFVRQGVSGDCDVRARINLQSASNGYAKSGVMLRDGTGAGAAHAAIYATPSNGFAFQYRTASGGATVNVSGPALNTAPNNWVRMTRTGNVFTAYVSANGTSWTQVSTATISMPSSILGGMAVCSHVDGDLGAASFDNVSVSDQTLSSVVANDTFDTGSATAANDSNDTGDFSWEGATLTLAADTTLGTGNALNVDVGGTFGGVFGEFDSRSLSDVGDSLKLSFDFRYTVAPPANSNGFRFGLYNSVGDGFGVHNGTGGTSGYYLIEDYGADNGFGAGGTVTTIATGSKPSINDQLKHSAALTLKKTTTGILVTSVVDGSSVSTTDTSPVTSTFNTISIHNGNMTADFRLDNVKVEFTNNLAPVFVSNPLVKPSVFPGNAYSGSIAGDATDGNGDALTFSKVSGPAWLAIASDGTLSGTPMVGDAGANSFVVRATDTQGGTADVTMTINVAGAVTAVWWDGSATSWNAAANWSTASGATTPNPGAVPGASNTMTFNISTVTTAQAITLDADQSSAGMTFASSGTTTFTGGGTNRTLTFDLGGLTLNAGAGAVTIGSATAGQNVAVSLLGPQIWTNGSSSALSVLNGLSLGANPLTISGNATISGVVSGSGSLTKQDGGTLVLSGANTYTGTTLIKGGTLQVGAGGTSGVLGTGAITNNASLVINRSDALTLGQAISGTGSLGKTSAGTLTVSGTNSYSGGTTLDNGTLNLSGDQSSANGGWTIGAAAANTTTVNFQAGSSVVIAPGKLVRIGNNVASGTTSQTLNVAGSVVNNGTLYNGRPGNLNLNSGGTWTQNDAMSLNGQGGYTSAMTVNSGATFTYTGTQTVKLQPTSGNSGNATLTLAGGMFVTGCGFESTIASTLATNSGLILNGGATLRLSANIPALAVTAGSPFVVLVGTGGATVDTQEFSTTLSLPVANVASQTGALTKTGSGTLVLGGNNTYTGTTTISAGVLQVGNGSGTGSLASTSVVNNGVLVINRTGTLTMSAVISGSGSFSHAGSGTTTLSGANTYAGETSVSAGTLTANSAFFADAAAIRLSTGAVLNLNHAATDVVDMLYIDGLAQASGNWGAIGSSAAHQTSLITGTGILNVTHGGTPYDAWAVAHGFNSVTGAVDADPDGDGANNLFEFAFDGDPTSSGSTGLVYESVQSIGGEDAFTFTIAVRSGASFSGEEGSPSAMIDGLTYTVEAGEDVNSWGTEPVDEVVPAITTGLATPDSGWEYHTFRAVATPAEKPQIFIRARVGQ